MTLHHRLPSLAPLVLVLGACGEPTPTPAAAPAPAAPVSLTTERSARAFAEAWSVVSATTDPSERDQRARELQQDWQGHVYTWPAHVLASLCTRGAPCWLDVFQRDGSPAMTSIGGAYVRVTLPDAAYTQLHDGCAGQVACRVTLTATLATIDAGAERPLALTFTDATLSDVRAPRADEPWYPPVRQVAAGAEHQTPRTGDATPFDASRLTAPRF